MSNRPRPWARAHQPLSLERGRWKENLGVLGGVNRLGGGLQSARRETDLQPPEGNPSRKRFVARCQPHADFEAFEFKWSYRHE
jgi:hypothetical protein